MYTARENNISFISFLFVVALICAKCNNPMHPGYTENGKVFHKIITVGNGEVIPDKNCCIIANITCRKFYDSLFLVMDSTYFCIDMSTIDSKVLFATCTKFREGDSASLLLNSKIFYRELLKTAIDSKVPADTLLQVLIKIINIVPDSMYNNYIKTRWHPVDAEMKEQILINDYLISSDSTNRYYCNGIYFQKITDGKGKIPVLGNYVKLRYHGYFIDGKPFDHTDDNEELPVFKLGREEHLLQGMELGVLQMNEGSKAKIIIPSYLAYGAKGSTTGIVPPYTTLIYEVELVNILQK